MRRPVPWALGAAVAVLLATSLPVHPVPSPTVDAPDHAAPSLVTDQVAVPVGATVAPLSARSEIDLGLTLQFSNDSRLTSLLANLSSPAGPRASQYVSAAAFRADFAPSARAVRSVESALVGVGGVPLEVAPDRLAVFARVPASGVESLLGVRLVSYTSATGATEYTAVGTPAVPSALAPWVVGVSGLTNARNGDVALAERLTSARSVDQYVFDTSTDTQWDVGSDFARAFGVSQLWPGAGSVASATYPTGYAIATLLASAYNSTYNEELPPYDPSVVTAYYNATLGPGWPHPTLTGVPIGVPAVETPPPRPGSFHGVNDSSEDEYENSLDLEMAGSLAPGAHLYTFYFAGSQMVSLTATYADLADDFALDLGAALNYTFGTGIQLAAISGSFGFPDLTDPLWDSELEVAAARGVTVLCATGDQGDAPSALTGRAGPWPNWPASAAFADWGSLAVGGTTISLNGRATSNATEGSIDAAYDPYVTGLTSATAWYQDSTVGDYAGSEGGVSMVYDEPTWQFHSAAQWPILNATETEGATALGRAEPDVAFPANNTIAFVFANRTGAIYLDILAGTSIAAPAFAGALVSLDAVASARAGAFTPLGFVDPELYRIASFYASAAVRGTAVEKTDPFLGVTTGHNFAFRAAAGWNPVTGWGEVNVTELLAAVSNATIANYVYAGPTPGLPHHAAPFFTTTNEYLLIGLGTLVALALVVIASRPPRRPTARPPLHADDPIFGPTSPSPAVAPGSTFSCPYCGAERPTEAVRCPRCGNL